MKKLVYLIVLALILGLVLTGCLLSNVGQVPTNEQSGISYLTKHTEDVPFESILWAGQDINVGVVKVWNEKGDPYDLHVKYVTSGGWVLTETHLAVATTLNDIPQKNGNPIPGKFPYQCCYDEDEGEWVFKIKKGGALGATCVADGNTNAILTEVEYIIPLSEIGEGVDCEELLFIAAHASLLNLDNIVGFVPDTGDPGDPIYQEETGWGDNGLGFPGKNWATYFEYYVQCPPCIVEYPADGNVYIGYEDWPNGDFDYNDFGMYFNAVETYEGGCGEEARLIKVVMTFTAQVYDSGMTHHIHIKRPIVGGSIVTVTRPDRAASGGETPASTYPVTGDVDVVLFDTVNYTWPSKEIGETVTVEIVVDDPSQNLKGTTVAPRWDLDPFMANYDPWEIGSMFGSLYHIGDTQLVTGVTSGAHPELLDLDLVGLTLPYILVVPSSDWVPPFEDTCISGPRSGGPDGPYAYFYDYYYDGSHTAWYNEITDTYVGLGGLSW